ICGDRRRTSRRTRWCPLRSLRLKALGSDLQFLSNLLPLSDSLLQFCAVLLQLSRQPRGFFGADERLQRRLALGNGGFEAGDFFFYFLGAVCLLFAFDRVQAFSRFIAVGCCGLFGRWAGGGPRPYATIAGF